MPAGPRRDRLARSGTMTAVPDAPVDPHRATSTHPPRRRPRGRVWWLGGGLLLLVLLVVAALPLLGVRGDAQQAAADLEAAAQALEDDDVAAARDHVASAREHVDEAREGAEGIGGDLWSVVPVAGTAVDDVRHLLDALDDTTAVAEIGVDLYPSVAGEQATLFRNETLDLPTLERVTSAAREAGGHLVAAAESLEQVEATTPLVGDTIAAQRDTATAQIAPMAEAYTELEPMLDQLPGVFGAQGERNYLVAMLNPAELRYSGGATLAFAPMSWRDGTLKLGESVDTTAIPRLNNLPISWPKVRGNTFHRSEKMIVKNATFAPSWSVSGEELLRAWKSATGKNYDGLIAVDVVTLARLFGVTGGVEVPGYGRLTEDNLVKTLIGSYDEYYPDPSTQDDLSAQIIPAFKDQLFDGGDYVAKASVLSQAAAGRHFALYFRDAEVQDGFAALGLEGDLAEPTGDYLGVFSQNTNGSKVDYWQRRTVSDKIRLETDGTAHHRLSVRVHNDTPPYVAPVPDPKFGYFTRWAGMFLTSFVPHHAEVERATSDGEPWDGQVRRFREHGFMLHQLMIEPSSAARVSTSYRVPDAAQTSEDELTYQLSVDPQGMVIPQRLDLRLTLPEGYTATELPAGWTVESDHTLRFTTEAFDASQTFEFTASAAD